ncbi:sialin-like [Scylla paramamosain]|uniref:sialin-like n=1 Tax=Scylla paramamosain TaxID=85552 RepID=UPI0030829287
MNMDKHTYVQTRLEKKEEEEEEEEEEEVKCLYGDPCAVVVVKGGDGGGGGGDGGGDPFSVTTTATDETKFMKKGWGTRHTVVTLTCAGVILLSMTRYSLSIVIVSMVAHPHAHTPTPISAHDLEVTGEGAAAVGGGGGGTCPAPVNVTTSDLSWNDTNQRFEWDERAQGLILGAYYYGNVLTNILGGRMAERTGSKPVILLGMLLSSLLSLLSPLAASLSTNFFIGVRLCLGFAQGLVMPAVSRCLVVWVPPYKRSKYNTIVFIGSEIGIVLSLSIGGWLCSQTFLGGWPAVFYMFGGAGVVWCVLWGLLIYETPDTHPNIASEEKKYLLAHCVFSKEKLGVPWVKVLRCLPFWAITIMHIGHNWGYYTFVSELPVYLSNMQHFSIKSNGLLSALPYLIKTTFALLFSLLIDRATAKGKLSVLSVRRIAMCVASYLPAAALIGMCFVGCDSVAAVVVMSAAVGVTGSAFCGLFCSHQDIAPHFAGTIYGVTNSLANITGFIAPGVVGMITFENQTVTAWNTVFLMSTLVYVVTCTFYIALISDQVQPFDSPTQRKCLEEEEKGGH